MDEPSREFKLKLTGNLLTAAIERAKVEQRNVGNDPGVVSMTRRALRDYLSKNHYSVDYLDGISSDPFPRARKGGSR